jgi:hypothetical protein
MKSKKQPVMELVDKYIYKTIITQVDYDGVSYIVKCQEEEEGDIWEVSYDDGKYFGPIDVENDSDLGRQLISFCQNQ